MIDTAIAHLIKPEDLQHHGTLFAGQMAKWFVEASFVAATRLSGRPQDIVCVQIHGMNFKKPAQNGDILEIKARVALTGNTSITTFAEAFVNEDDEPMVAGFITFVTVDGQGRPYRHGLTLTEEYISQNTKIYEEARRVRELSRPSAG